MKNVELFESKSFALLTELEENAIKGGDTVIVLRDSHGFEWRYRYSDSGTLISVCVCAAMAVI